MAPGDRDWWEDYRNRLERAAQQAAKGQQEAAESQKR